MLCSNPRRASVGFAGVPPDRLLDGGRGAVVEQRPAEAQSPQRRCANLLGRPRLLLNPVAGTDVVEQQIGEERHGHAIEERIRARAGRQRRCVAGRAADGAEDLLAVPRGLVDRAAGERREELHEAREVVDAASAGARIPDVLGIGNRIAHAHALRRDADRDLLREEIVGDAHLVAIGVGAERQQRRVLRFPAEAADAPFAGRDGR